MNPTHQKDPALPWLPAMRKREDDGVLELRLDWTAYSKLEECYRKGGHLISMRREADYRDSAMAFGRAIHAALDVRQKVIMAKSTSELQAKMEAALEPEFAGAQLDDDEHRTLGRAKDTVGVYLATFGEFEPFDILDSERAYERLLGRIRFDARPDANTLESREVDLYWQGKIDGEWEQHGTKKRYIKDTKVVGRDDSERDQAIYAMGGQFKGYCWLRGYRAAILDQVIVRKPTQRKTAKSPPEIECKRLLFDYADSQIAEWREHVMANVADWLTSCARFDRPPRMNTSGRACAWPKPCPYLIVCQNANEKDRMMTLEQGPFRDWTWDAMKEKQL